jgi:hypothetical protein
MALAVEIARLRDRVLADLTDAHDYYTNTTIAWDIVHKFIAAGQTITIRNLTTGTLTTQVDLLSKSGGYIAEQLAEATFQKFVSTFEIFLLDLTRLWLTTYPQSLGAKQVDFRDILNAVDKDAITLLVVEKELADIFHGPPSAWFRYIDDRVKLGCPTPDEIQQFAEAKASRDLLEHNRGIVNSTYRLKAGKLARYDEGKRIEIPDDYHRRSWVLINKLVLDISNAAIAKVI